MDFQNFFDDYLRLSSCRSTSVMACAVAGIIDNVNSYNKYHCVTMERFIADFMLSLESGLSRSMCDFVIM